MEIFGIELKFLFDLIGGVLVLLGGVMVIIGTIGLVRMKDVYARIHATGMIDTGGVPLMLLGMMFLGHSFLVGVKLGAIAVFLFFTSPISGHAIARAAFHEGIKPDSRDFTGKNLADAKPPPKKRNKKGGKK